MTTKQLTLTLIFCFSVFISYATSIPVTSHVDSGAGSLRNAVANAAGGDTITFSLNMPDTIRLQSRIEIDSSVVIIGPGSQYLEITMDSLDTNILKGAGGTMIEISGISFSGAAAGASGNKYQAAISTFYKMTLSHCRIHHNYGNGIGGRIFELNHCEIDHNCLGPRVQYGHAGIFDFTGEIHYCYIHHNQNAGIYSHEVVITHSTISYNEGSGLYYNMDWRKSLFIDYDLKNTTLSHNRECGIQTSYAMLNSPMTTGMSIVLEHCSVIKNGASGVYKFFPFISGVPIGPFSPTIFTIQNSIVAGNGHLFAGIDVYDGAGVDGFFSGTHNIIGDGSSNMITNSQMGTTSAPLDPKMLPLAYNGGFTPTHALAPCSPAINGGDTTTLSTDQRDSVRHGLPDIGAYEYNPAGFDGPYNLSGTVTTSTGAPLKNTKIYVIGYQPGDTSITALDSTFSDTTGFYEVNFWGKEVIYVKAAPDSATYPTEMPTYYDSALVFQDAMPDSLCEDSMQINFSTLAGGNPGGPGFIGGKLVEGANKGPGDPVGGVTLVLVDITTGQGVDWLVTASDGSFAFDQLPYGSYELWADKPLIDNSVAPYFVVDMDTVRREELEIALHSTYLELLAPVIPQPPFSLAGTVFTSQGSALENTWVYALAYQAADSSVNVLDSALSDANGAYELIIPDHHPFYLKVSPDSASYQQEMPTYVDGQLVFQDATSMIVRDDTIHVDFASLEGGNPGGSAFIGGTVQDLWGLLQEGLTLILVDQQTGKGVDWLQTGAGGAFEFAQLPYGSYEVWVDKPFIDNSAAPLLRVNMDTIQKERLQFILHPTYLELLPQTMAIDDPAFGGEFLCYPNPMKQAATFLLKNYVGTCKLEIVSLDGKVIHQGEVRADVPYRFDRSELPGGLYFYVLTEKGIPLSRGKIVVQD